VRRQPPTITARRRPCCAQQRAGPQLEPQQEPQLEPQYDDDFEDPLELGVAEEEEKEEGGAAPGSPLTPGRAEAEARLRGEVAQRLSMMSSVLEMARSYQQQRGSGGGQACGGGEVAEELEAEEGAPGGSVGAAGLGWARIWLLPAWGSRSRTAGAGFAAQLVCASCSHWRGREGGREGGMPRVAAQRQRQARAGGGERGCWPAVPADPAGPEGQRVHFSVGLAHRTHAAAAAQLTCRLPASCRALVRAAVGEQPGVAAR
jgi:hypothetical protein